MRMRYLVPILAAIALAGCDDGPSDADVSQAIKTLALEQIKAQNQMAKAVSGMLGGSMGGDVSNSIQAQVSEAEAAIENAEIDVLRIDENSDGSYSAEVTMTTPQGTTTDRITLVAKGDKWVIRH